LTIRALILAVVLASTAFAQSSKCTCADGNGSYLYLRCPKAPPADPDPCPATHHGIHPKKNPPKSWNDACWLSPRMACFLRRHAASWKITCSLCAKKRCCPFPNWHNCPECHKEGKATLPDDRFMKVLADQRRIGGKRTEMAISPHYAMVTDIRSLKIATTRGAPRIATQHELLHLYLQRAELARRDWAKVFGNPREMRSMMILVRSDSTRQAFSAKHLGNSGTNLLYGGGKGNKLGGLAGNGFIIWGRDDDALHFQTRHMIGHLCISTYHSGNAQEKHLPQWLFRGSAHWLCKLHPRAKDYVTFCSYEGVTVNGSGKRWLARARAIAARGPDRDPVERMLQAATAKQMNYEMHVRSWSWFEVFTRDDPERFVAFVKLLREAKEPRLACKAAFEQAPELVDDRWRERVLGKRRDVEATNREGRDKDVDAASSRELSSIARERDLQLLASRIRGLDRCQNVRSARLLIAMLDSKDSDRVREVIALVLSRTTDEKVKAYLRSKGYEKAGNYGRATILRVVGETKDSDALGLARAAMADSFWLVQANACRALAQLGDEKSIAAIALKGGKSGNGKVRIAAMDALGDFGSKAKSAFPLVERNIMNRRWQVKVAAIDNFVRMQNRNAVDTLIGRLDLEGGRVHDAIRIALKAMTGMDRDWNSELWRKWWKKAKRWAELEKKSKAELDKERQKPKTSTPKNRYATTKKPPTYYGIKVYARAVAYVLDTSLSMNQGFVVSKQWQEKLGHKLDARTRIGVAKQELAQAIKDLDPRTRINLIFFNDRVRQWQDSPVPAGANGDSAISKIRNVKPAGQTNYYGALRLVLGFVGERASRPGALKDTPDTVFFLTDGTPTDGEITKADELLAWFSERNRFARLRVHVIAMGTTSVDVDFLRKLATQNSGIFLHMTGQY